MPLKPWWSAVSAEDKEIIQRQLGRSPQGLLAVARRCRNGAPQIIVNAPVAYGPGRRSEKAAGVAPGTPRVFPTMYWLTCPHLAAHVSRLEGRGEVVRTKKWLETAGLCAAMDQAHIRAAQERVAAACATGIRMAEENAAQWEVLSKSGIGGMRNPAGIKCLHMHLADYLAGVEEIEGGTQALQFVERNPVGARTASLLAQNGVDLSGCDRCRCCPG